MYKWLSLSVVIIGFDQLTKVIAARELVLYVANPVLPGFNLTLMHNTGAAFSFLSQAGGWQRGFFIILASAVSLFLLYWMHSLEYSKRWLLCALSLLLGGAVGNLIDRIRLGYVVDFIEVYYRDYFWPVFNVADSAITVGAIMLMIDAIWLNSGKYLR